MKGSQLQTSNSLLVREPRGSDPTERFFRVVAIVDELESGKFPLCRWVQDAPSLIVGFFTYQPTYAPGNADRVIAAYQRFIEKHFQLDETFELNNGVGYLISSRIPDLYKAKGEPASNVLQMLEALERTVPDASAVRYVEARYYAVLANDRNADRAALLRTANEKLVAVSKETGTPYARKALATLASQQFYERDFAAAIETYKAYLIAYPASAWAWVAGMRMGQAQGELGDWRAARETFRQSATDDAVAPMARRTPFRHSIRRGRPICRRISQRSGPRTSRGWS